jgi:hypothetical protein
MLTKLKAISVTQWNRNEELFLSYFLSSVFFPTWI